MTKVSVILPTKNMESSIGSLLENIFAQDFDGDIEVLVMDSSDDATPEIARSFGVEVVRVETEDYNYGKTRNEGAAATDGDILVFISADVEIKDRRWLSKLTSHFSDSKVAGVYGRQYPKADATPMEQFFILQTYATDNEVLSYGGGKLKTRGMVFFSNTNSAIRRSVWQEIQIPEMLKGEDHEWAKRALLASYNIIYDSDAAVCHSNRYSLKSVFRDYFDNGAVMPVISREGNFDHSFRRFVLDGSRFVLREYQFIVRRGYWYWLPYAMVYDSAKFLGAFLGARQKYMPLWLKRSLCRKRNHWNRYDDVIKEPS